MSHPIPYSYTRPMLTTLVSYQTAIPGPDSRNWSETRPSLQAKKEVLRIVEEYHARERQEAGLAPQPAPDAAADSAMHLEPLRSQSLARQLSAWVRDMVTWAPLRVRESFRASFRRSAATREGASTSPGDEGGGNGHVATHEMKAHGELAEERRWRL